MILTRILEHKKAEIRRKRSRGYLGELQARIADRPAPLGFLAALQAGATERAPALIAEVKKASPSQGLMRPEFAETFDPVAIAQTYERHGASALSILTDEEYFQGSLTYLDAIRKDSSLPALNKEFMVDDIQFYEARANGADCVLLIASALDRVQLCDLYQVARGLQLDVLIETHDEREIDTVLEHIADVDMIGINNRDLRTFTTDLNLTAKLAQRIPAGMMIVSESGIHSRDDVMAVHTAGAGAMLIGESLIKADDIGAKLNTLLDRQAPAVDAPAPASRWV